MAELAIINGYDIRDRKLADATTVTGVESSDSIVLKTTGGAYANILKEDFTKAVRSVLGGLLNTADKGTSIEKVACLGTTDHDFGSISTANLASVLGGKLTKFNIINYTNIGYASILGLGKLRIVTQNIVYSTIYDVTIIGSKNGYVGVKGCPIKCYISFDKNPSGVPIATYASGEGNIYYKRNNDNTYDFIVAPITTIDYSNGYILSCGDIPGFAQILNDNDVDLTSYTSCLYQHL